ncbi:hypothetical protein ACJX0J_016362, partial [Zea mays]
FFSYIISYGQRAMDATAIKLLSNYRLTVLLSVRHHYIREAVASGWSDKSFTDTTKAKKILCPIETTYHEQHELGTNEKKKIPAKYIMLSDIVGGHAEIIHTERMSMHLMGEIQFSIVWNLEEKIHILELNIEKPQEWYTLTKEEKIKVLDIEALDNLQRELICGPHFLHYITEIPDQELLHKAHFLILQSTEDVSKVTTLMDTLSTHGAQGEKKNCCLDLIKIIFSIMFCINIVLDVSKKF